MEAEDVEAARDPGSFIKRHDGNRKAHQYTDRKNVNAPS